MIRNTYGLKHWTIPGGKKRKRETPLAGAAREAKEEIGLTLVNLIFLGTYSSTRQHKKDTVYYYYAKANNFNFKIDLQEIEEAGWFAYDNLPRLQSFAVRDVLNLKQKFDLKK